VSYCTVDGGGHTWPGGLPVPAMGKTTNELSATDAMWDFFSRFSTQ
jgi:polyhydroxybutyrate depolymerase